MASFVVFNGITRLKPGGITKVDTAALNQVVISPNSVVGLIGEATAGPPGSEEFVTVDAPETAVALYKSGPLVDAVNLAFQSSSDPDVPGGASQVRIYKTNNSTQATASSASHNSGLFTPLTADSGSTTTVVDAALTTSFPVDDCLIGWDIAIRGLGGSNPGFATVTDYVSSTGTLTFAPAIGTLVSASDSYILIAPTHALGDVAASGGTATTIPLTTNTALTVDELAGRKVFLITTLSGTDYGSVSTIVSNTADTLTVSPGLPGAPVEGDIALVLADSLDLTSTEYGTAANGIKVDYALGDNDGTVVTVTEQDGTVHVSSELGARNKLRVFYRDNAVKSTDTVDGTTASASTIELTTGGLTPSAEVGYQVRIMVDGEWEYTVINTNSADQLALDPALSAVPAAAAAVEIMEVNTFAEIGPLVGTSGWFEGSNGDATSFKTRITGGSTSDELNISISATDTLQDLITTIQANPNYTAVVAPGVNALTTLASDMEFGPANTYATPNTNGILAQTDLVSAFRDGGFTTANAEIRDYFNDISEVLDATIAATGSGIGAAVDGGQPPVIQGLAAFQGAGALENTGSVLTDNLQGGTRGVSANSDFQNGFDAMMTKRTNSVVPLIDEDLANEGNSSTATWAAVSQQLLAHVTEARGAGASERGGFLGLQGTKDEVITQANIINDMDVALCCQNPTALDAIGNLVEFGPREMAVMAASMRSGVSALALPLTHKSLRVSGVTQDSSWDPRDISDSNDMIRGGILFTETVDGQGTRWVRDLTTWVSDNNLAMSEGSVRDAVRIIAYGLRDALVTRYVGKKAAPATIGAVKDTATTYLELARSEEVIVDSTDPTTGATIRAYHNLKVSSSGDTVFVSVGVFPVPGVNFILNEIFLQLPTQSA